MKGIDPIGTLRHIYRRANQLFDLVNAILMLTETGGSVTTTGPGTEDNIYINETPMGVYKPVKVQIDFTAQEAADTTVVRVRYRITPGGGKIKKDEQTFAGVQDPLLKNIELEPNRYGLSVTIETTIGTVRAYPWAVFYEV